MMQNALKEYLNSKMTGSFAQSDNLLQRDAQYQALVASLLNGNLADGSSKLQQTSHLDQNCSQMHRRKQEEQYVFTSSPQLGLKDHNPLLNGVQQESVSIRRKHKKGRLDVNQDTVLKEHVLQKMQQSQYSAELERDQRYALFQHNVITNQDQQAILSAAPQLAVDREKPQQWTRHPIPQQEMVHQATAMLPVPQQEKVQQATAVHQPGVCSHRLMQYLYHTRTRPNDNNLAYWKRFVAEFYDPCAKRRWCLSCYDEVGDHDLGASPCSKVSPWTCGVCNCQSGQGFEASFEVLPRLSKITFEGGVVDELLFLELPRESRFYSGLLMLECGRAVQESVYERLRVVHEGQLRIIFSPTLKILSWEFCARSHEIFLRRTTVAPQASELCSAVRNYQSALDDRVSDGVSSQDVQSNCNNAVRNYQSALDDRVSDGVSSQDVQSNCNKILEVGGQVEKALDLHEVDHLGFSKKYTRCLQIADVVDNMKDLMTLCQVKGTSPIESLKSYCRETPTKLQRKKISGKGQKESAQGLPKDVNKLMATSCGLIRSNANKSCSSIKAEGFSNVPDYNSIASRDSKWQTSLNQRTPFEGPKTSNSGQYKNSEGNGLLSSNSSMQQDATQNLIHEFVNSRAVNRHDRDEVTQGSGKRAAIDLPSTVWGRPAAAAALGNVLGSMPVRNLQSQSNAAFTRNLSEVGGNFHAKALLPESGFSMPNGYHDHHKFYGNDKSMNYGWKA